MESFLIKFITKIYIGTNSNHQKNSLFGTLLFKLIYLHQNVSGPLTMQRRLDRQKIFQRKIFFINKLETSSFFLPDIRFPL